SSLQFDEVNLEIEEKAEELGSPLFSFGYDWVAEKTENGMIYKSNRGNIELPKPGLLGDHQIVNAGAAITAAKCLKGFNITDDHIREGIRKVKWPARMQHVDSGKLVDMLPKGWE